MRAVERMIFDLNLVIEPIEPHDLSQFVGEISSLVIFFDFHFLLPILQSR